MATHRGFSCVRRICARVSEVFFVFFDDGSLRYDYQGTR